MTALFVRGLNQGTPPPPCLANNRVLKKYGPNMSVLFFFDEAATVLQQYEIVSECKCTLRT